MSRKLFCNISIALLLFSVAGCRVVETSLRKQQYTLENAFVARTVSVADDRLKTISIINKRLGQTISTPADCDEFRLRISEGTHTTGTDVILTAKDFVVKSVKDYPLPEDKGKGIVVEVTNAVNDVTVQVHYELAESDFYLRKYLEITSGKSVTLERIDVEVIGAPDAYQPYKLKLITANAPGQWKPGLGQPLFTTETGTFWGMEFPAADNVVADKTLTCGYLWGRQIKAGATYQSYRAVVGAADDAEFISNAFYEYIDQVRVRPLRLRVQYNSWFDYGNHVSQEKFIESVSKIHQELQVKRGNKPFQSFVIDDGWQDTRDWKDTVWNVNDKFDQDFHSSLKAVENVDSELGLWLSPQCNFGGRPAVEDMRKNGFEALDTWMSLAGPKYMKALGNRLVELTKLGVSYFKLDGCFGHLNVREFDIYGDKHDLPYMPQLGLEGLKPGSKELNESKYDELKTYYLVAGSEKLMGIFEEMGRVNPDVYIVISNGAWLSPWWLMHCDAVWMINAGDAAGGSSRTQELVYRDKIYYQIWAEENTQFPMNSLFNHEPKKTKTGESEDAFRDYLYMNLSRGTGFVELYIKTFTLEDQDWDVLSEGLKWVHRVFPTFARSRMHGGNPAAGEVYGFTGWNAEQGYISIHNPGDEAQSYTFTLDRKFGLVPNSGPFKVSAPARRYAEKFDTHYSYGDTITVELEGREIIILNFDK